MQTLPPTSPYHELLAHRRRAIATTLQQLLPVPGEFTWEVGAGHGHFLTAYAAAHPDQTCIGIDIIGERVERAVRKRDRARLSNLNFFHAEARLFLEALPLHATVRRTFILFPDPWPKLRHHKHRILQADFLRQLAARATADARLHFRTDHLPYFESALETVAGSPEWEPCQETWPFEHVTVFQSRAEQHYSITARRRPS